jgi:signal transduction histidine kinase
VKKSFVLGKRMMPLYYAILLFSSALMLAILGYGASSIGMAVAIGGVCALSFMGLALSVYRNYGLRLSIKRASVFAAGIIPFLVAFLIVDSGELEILALMGAVAAVALSFMAWYYSRLRILGISGVLIVILTLSNVITFFLAIAVSYGETLAVFLLLFAGEMALLLILAHLLRKRENTIAAGQKAMLEKALKSERFKTEMITNVSHDIKNPLTSIISYADILGKMDLQGPAREYADILLAKSSRMKVLIEDLIEATKAGTGNIDIKLESINLAELEGQIAGEFEEKMAAAGLQLVDKAPKGPIYVKADGRRLWRVMENLFSNALKHSLPGTRVYAGIGEEDGLICFTLKNISREPLNMSIDEFVEMFSKGDRARSTEGSGLGLYIAKTFTESMGGRLDIEIKGDLFETVVALERPAAPAPEPKPKPHRGRREIPELKLGDFEKRGN